MWLALILGIVLTSGAAAAFECAGVTLPSSLVLCSDPELMQLADERQEAIDEARARIGEEAWPALWEDQKAWVRSYATACGVPPDRSPPVPVPAGVRQCFKRAAAARIAYIRAFGLSTARAAAQPSVAKTGGAAGPDPPRIRDEVALEATNGIYVVPVLINGVLPLRFTVDSGSADVSLPADVFLTLVRTGTIGQDDYIGSEKYRLADGSIVESNRFYIHELRVGSLVIANVAASVEKITSVPLLGQTFLSKFASWAVDNERHVLTLTAASPTDATAHSNIPSQAQTVRDLTIARKAAKLLDATLKQTGITGINIEIDDCYAKAQTSKAEAKIEQCFMIDFLASKLDSAFLEAMHLSQPKDSRNTIGAVNSRVNRAFDLLGLDAPQRDKKISEWVRAGLLAANE